MILPYLRPGQIVVMDNLSAHKGERVRELVERAGCELRMRIADANCSTCHPTHRSKSHRRSLLQGKKPPAQDARGFFARCGYGMSVQSL